MRVHYAISTTSSMGARDERLARAGGASALRARREAAGYAQSYPASTRRTPGTRDGALGLRDEGEGEGEGGGYSVRGNTAARPAGRVQSLARACGAQTPGAVDAPRPLWASRCPCARWEGAGGGFVARARRARPRRWAMDETLQAPSGRLELVQSWARICCAAQLHGAPGESGNGGTSGSRRRAGVRDREQNGGSECSLAVIIPLLLLMVVNQPGGRPSKLEDRGSSNKQSLRFVRACVRAAASMAARTLHWLRVLRDRKSVV